MIQSKGFFPAIWGRWAVLTLLSLSTSVVSAQSQSLWSQRSGSCLLALNYPAQSTFRVERFGRLFVQTVNVESADDFVVPAGRIWNVSAARGSGNANVIGTSMWVRVYREQDNLPEADPVCSHVGTAIDVDLIEIANGYFQVDLPEDSCMLAEGRYWMSISQRQQVNIPGTCPTPESCPIWAIRQFIGTPPPAADRDWAIRDTLGNISGIACEDFGPASTCRGEATGSNLCFEVVGEDLENLPPQVSGALPFRTLPVDDSATLDLAPLFSDDGLSPVTYSAPDLPPHFSLDPNTGELTGTPPASVNGQDAYFEVFADDGLTERGSPATLALQYFDPDALRLGEQFQGEVVVRCSTDRVTGSTVESELDFAVAGSCSPTGGAQCPAVDPERRVSNVLVAAKLRHPSIRELTLTVTAPTDVSAVLANGLSSNGEVTFDGCPEPDLNAVFADTFVWPSEQSCDVGKGLVGYVEPLQSLARFRNGPVVGDKPWKLDVTNVGTDDLELDYWCVALQLNDSELPVFPPADLPGSAVISEQFDFINDPIEFSGELRGESDVDWYLIDQNEFNTLQRIWQELSVSVTPAPELALRVSRYFENKFAGFPPKQISLGNCIPGETVTLPRRNGSSDFLRIQGCPGSATGSYEITLTPDGGIRSVQPQEVGVFAGDVIDSVTQEPLSGVFLFAPSGIFSVSNADGDFVGANLNSSDEVLEAYKLGYEPGISEVFEVIPNQQTNVPTIVMTPQVQQAIVNDAVFLGGDFESP
ncbi:MAG: putative Ig domain-containing protein [Pseudomonadota bacterium]